MLSVHDIRVSFDDQEVLRGIDLDVKEGEIVCLLGPSGCGKTTLLRVIAGLEHFDSGSVEVEGRDMSKVPIHQRDFGLVFQDFALFPHMTVAENVVFGLRMKGHKNQQARTREVLELVGLGGFEDRDVTALSGGEKQRVALARSLAPNPRLLMLDEPLGSLDANLRDRLVVELRDIIKQVGLTAVYVTHDQQEAFAVADRIAVMNVGQIEQIATPEKIYRQPGTVFVARFMGLNNIVPVMNYREGQAYLEIGDNPVDAPDFEPEVVLLHPDGLTLSDESDNNPPTLKGEVTECVFRGSLYRLQVDVQGITLGLQSRRYVEVGQQVGLHAAPDAWVPLRS